MVYPDNIREQLVFTIPDRCRVCYTCVRECPVKAIRIENRQAAVMHERCIACGNCVKVCSQGAKAYLRETDRVQSWLKSGESVIALLAPSFPAEFTEIEDPGAVVTVLRHLGFERICEVGFGADLVARAYSQLIADPDQPAIISSDCPAIVEYVEHYHPELCERLAPVVSPMVAMTRVVKRKYGEKAKIVFIGPCIGKKAESIEVDAGLTFSELRCMLADLSIEVKDFNPSQFDPPHAAKGGIFPVKRGLLQALELPEDLFEGQVVVAEGRANFPGAISEFKNGSIADQNMELLCCDGCIMGPGMSPSGSRFQRRSKVGGYVRQKLGNMDLEQWKVNMNAFQDIDLSCTFKASDQRLILPTDEKIHETLLSMGKLSENDHLNCGACGYDSCRNHAIAISQGLAEIDMCLPQVIEKLENTQQALKQSEKLAHMGQLSAGIAHELNNPLGVVMMYANLMLDDHPEGTIRKDIEMIVEQADRCKRIVSNLLNFARKNQLRKDSVDVKQLLSDSVDAILIPDSVKVDIEAPETGLYAVLDREQFIQVLSNLSRNAVDAMPEGGELRLKAKLDGLHVVITVEDTGSGIKQEHMDKLFTPFFTTKEYGRGTGLGLATSYGIVKMHKGHIDVESNTNSDEGTTGTCFTLRLPSNE